MSKGHKSRCEGHLFPVWQGDILCVQPSCVDCSGTAEAVSLGDGHKSLSGRAVSVLRGRSVPQSLLSLVLLMGFQGGRIGLGRAASSSPDSDLCHNCC